MMNLLLTGATGFIGKHVLQELLQKTKYKITVMIRPDTKSRLNDFMDEVDIVEIDLTNIYKLRSYLSENIFEKIIHIGAIRGGRKYSKTDYFTANVKATEQIALAAKEANSRLVFCSSVGVFGAIPLELPANNQTQKQTDNYYHYTKIEAEKIIQKQVLYGLDAIIIRPAITYGVGDYGFPYTLTKMIDKKILFMPNKIVRIHLTNVHVLAEGFVKALNNNIKTGSIFNIADKEPVELSKLADFINQELQKGEYSKFKIINKKFFEVGESISKFFKNELWVSRFQLISKSWYYDTKESYEVLKIHYRETIPEFKIVTNWYKQITKKD